MHLHHTRVFDGQEVTAQTIRKPAGNKQMKRSQAGAKLRGIAAVLLTMASCMPSGLPAQTPAGTKGPDREASTLPTAPAPVPTDPFDLNRAGRDFSKPYAGFWSVNKYRATSIPKASFENSVRLNDMLKDGKIYLSLSDAIALAIENNYDIAIARYDLSIADTDILRAKTGAATLGVPSGLVTNTLGGSTSTLTTGGGPGGTTVGSGGAGSGASGLTLTTAGAGPAPEILDPNLTGTVYFERNHVPANKLFLATVVREVPTCTISH